MTTTKRRTKEELAALKERMTTSIEVGENLYRIVTTGFSSRVHGNCEVCGEHASEVFEQTKHEKSEFIHMGYYYKFKKYGHLKCLEEIRD